MSDSAAISLSGKIVIITGAGGGLGSAMARSLARAGAKIAGIDTSEEALNRLGAELKQMGATFLPVIADISLAASAETAVNKVVSALGGVDILINNAGLGGWASQPPGTTGPIKFWNATPEGYQRILDVNALGPFNVTRAAVKPMIAKKWGRIINITTSYDTMVRGGGSAYGPSKAALEAQSAVWADDLKDTGVTVNVLIPGGAVKTGLLPPDRRDAVDLLAPEIMMAPIPWLASERSDGVTACRFIAEDWDLGMSSDDAAARTKAPAAWYGYAVQALNRRRTMALAAGKALPQR